MMNFQSFDPLEFKNTAISDAAIGALKREISNILSSYVGWYDPFCELIQNALDAVEARTQLEISAGTEKHYNPKIDIRIDLDENALTVTDNGIGLDKDKFQQFLAPNFSFKTGKTRGHKGVGATYVAYGFNYLRVSSKVPGFEASGRIIGARKWLLNNVSGANPRVEPDQSAYTDDNFVSNDRSVSITVRFDETTHPKKLDWIKAETAEKWLKILSVKSGIGSVFKDETIVINILVRHKLKDSFISNKGTSYLWLHESASKKATFAELVDHQDYLYKKFGPTKAMPDKYKNLDFIYGSWTSAELMNQIGASVDEEEKEIIDKHSPTVSFEFGYTAKLWQQFNSRLGIRSNHRVLTSGIQLAANNMPQGEAMLLPLNRNIGRQNQLHFLIHFDNYTPDMGRKGFHRELTDFAKSISRTIAETHLFKLRNLLKANSGLAPDLQREMAINEWKADMLAHEHSMPLILQNENFFKPIEKISITSIPTREQDAIALFHQLIAGGVVRGINIMSTNERFTYDGLFKISFEHEPNLYTYDEEKNPLGVPIEVSTAMSGKITSPRVLEYKFSLDGLVEDFDNNDKNIKDIDLCIAWSIGESYKERYGVTSLLIPENADQRQYHGITHVLTDIDSNSKHCDLIILKELINYLNDPIKEAERQRVKYE